MFAVGWWSKATISFGARMNSRAGLGSGKRPERTCTAARETLSLGTTFLLYVRVGGLRMCWSTAQHPPHLCYYHRLIFLVPPNAGRSGEEIGGCTVQ